MTVKEVYKYMWYYCPRNIWSGWVWVGKVFGEIAEVQVADDAPYRQVYVNHLHDGP